MFNFFSTRSRLTAHQLHGLIIVAIITLVYILAEWLGVSSVFADALVLSPLFGLGGSSDCGNSSSGGDGGDAGGGGGGDAGRSTPFLCTWNGTAYEFENDFLFGHPETFFNNVAFGKSELETGNVGADLYHIKNQLGVVDGKVKFQVREVEAEESFIDHVAFKQIVYPKNGVVGVRFGQSDYFIFDKEELKHNQHVEQTLEVRGSESILPITKYTGEIRDDKKGCFLDVDDTLEITAKTNASDKPALLLVESFYRDWSRAQRIVEANNQKNSVLSFMQRTALTRYVAVFILVIAFGFSGAVDRLAPQNAARAAGTNEPFTFKSLLEANTAHADTRTTGGSRGCSLVIEWWNWKSGAYTEKEIIHPRHHQNSLDVMVVPDWAQNDMGEIKVRITATRKHFVNTACIFVPDSLLSADAHDMQVTQITHTRTATDHIETIAAKQNGEYIHTVPGDVVEIEAAVPPDVSADNRTIGYLFSASGIYSNLSAEGARASKAWPDNLSADSRAVLAMLDQSRAD